MLRAARRFPEPLATLLCLFIPRKLIQTRKEQFAFGIQRVDKRLQQTTDRPDFSESLPCLPYPSVVHTNMLISPQCHTSSTQTAKRA